MVKRQWFYPNPSTPYYPNPSTEFSMSCFTVLIVGPTKWQEIDETLAPFDENLVFPSYIKFTREDKKREKKRLQKYWRKQVALHPHDVGVYNKLLTLLNLDNEQYFENCTCLYESTALNTAGEPISIYNPNSKFGSWELAPMFRRLKAPDDRVCILSKKHVAWSRMADLANEQARYDWGEMQTYSESQQRLVFDKWRGDTKETYITRKTQFSTHAYILRDRWYERGQIGWWAEVENEIPAVEWMRKYADMLKSLKDNTVLTAIRCKM